MKNIVGYTAFCALLCFGPAAGTLRAGVIVNSSISLPHMQITPASGSLSIILPWTATAFAQALDSVGGSDSQFNSMDNGATSAAAATSLASASGNASALGQTGGAFSGVNIPGLEASSSSTGRGSFFGMFQINSTDSTPISVLFSAMLTVDQFLQTNGTGESASSEVVFTLTLDGGDQPIFLDNILSVGANTTEHSVTSPTLSGSATLDPNTPHFFFLELDSESSGVTAPEPSAGLLMAAGFCVLGVCFRARRAAIPPHARR